MPGVATLGSVNAPTKFLTLRRKLSRPEFGPYAIARDLHLPMSSVAAVFSRLPQATLDHPRLMLDALRAGRRPRHVSYPFRVSNPKQWFRAFGRTALLSGDEAAGIDGFNLMPARRVVYIDEGDRAAAMDAATAVLGAYSPDPEVANLEIRIADPWLRPDSTDPRLVERGQRLVDYAESKHIQILIGMKNGVL